MGNREWARTQGRSLRIRAQGPTFVYVLTPHFLLTFDFESADSELVNSRLGRKLGHEHLRLVLSYPHPIVLFKYNLVYPHTYFYKRLFCNKTYRLVIPSQFTNWTIQKVGVGVYYYT